LGEGEFQAQVDLPADAQAWFFNFITADDLVVSSEYYWSDIPQEEEQVDSLRYSLVSGSGDTHNHRFSLSETGELLALQSFDLEEMGDELSIRVQVIDEYGEAFEKSIGVPVLNVIEDMDGDGVENHWDLDDDGDGFSDEVEIAYGSNPLDPTSLANAYPEFVPNQYFSILENSPAGSVVGTIEVFDPDESDNISFEQIIFDPLSVSGLTAWFDAADQSSIVVDPENNQVISWANKIDHEVKLLPQQTAPKLGDSINQLATVHFGPNEYLSTKKTGAEWNPFGIDGQTGSLVENASWFAVIHFYENKRTQLSNFGVGWAGHLPWDDGRIYWDIWKDEEDNRMSSKLTDGFETMILSMHYSFPQNKREIYKNGSLITSADAVVTSVNGAFTFPGSDHHKTSPEYLVGEMIFTNLELIKDDRLGLEGYLAGKWGLSDVLSEGNPYRVMPFVVDDLGRITSTRSFDYESETDPIEYPIIVRIKDDFGDTTEETLTIHIEDQHLPVVETMLPVSLGDQWFELGASLVDNGGVTGSIQTGLIYSSSPLYGSDISSVDHLVLEGVSDETYLGNLQISNEFETIYLMAYASNEEGVGYGLEEKIRNDQKIGSKNFGLTSIPLPNSSGWWENETLGNYYIADNGWWYHDGLGWLYVSGSHDDGLWIWKDGLGWVWTRESVYPFLYSYEKGSWYYFYGELDQRRLLYDYGEERWVNLDDTAMDESKGKELEQ